MAEQNTKEKRKWVTFSIHALKAKLDRGDLQCLKA
jgi:hypothetical protein